MIWVSASAQNAVMSMQRFDSMAECQAVKRAVLSSSWVGSWVSSRNAECIEYKFDETKPDDYWGNRY